MPNKNEPKPSFWPEKRKDSDEVFQQAEGCAILSDDPLIHQGGPGRAARTDKWQEKDKSDAYGN